jgi:hypothetical protein
LLKILNKILGFLAMEDSGLITDMVAEESSAHIENEQSCGLCAASGSIESNCEHRAIQICIN